MSPRTPEPSVDELIASLAGPRDIITRSERAQIVRALAAARVEVARLRGERDRLEIALRNVCSTHDCLKPGEQLSDDGYPIPPCFACSTLHALAAKEAPPQPQESESDASEAR